MHACTFVCIESNGKLTLVEVIFSAKTVHKNNTKYQTRKDFCRHYFILLPSSFERLYVQYQYFVLLFVKGTFVNVTTAIAYEKKHKHKATTIERVVDQRTSRERERDVKKK